MLKPIAAGEALAAAESMHRIYPRFIKQQFGWDRTDEPISYFTTEAGPGSLLVCYRGAYFMLLGAEEHCRTAAADIINFHIEPLGSFPGDRLKEEWEKREDKRRFVEISAFGQGWTDCLAGLPVAIEPEHEPGGHGGAYYYHAEGEPRFSQYIKHPCRVVERGLELFELMKRATNYDPTGEYKQQCLENGPSFVCEINGEPVCWSCTHLNRMLGMIYVPDEQRGKGYGQSLAAFHFDHALRTEGYAACYVMNWNAASQGMLNSIGVGRLPAPMVWRTLWLDPKPETTA